MWADITHSCGSDLNERCYEVQEIFHNCIIRYRFVGCGSVKSVFRGKDADARKAQEPADLADFTPTVKVGKLWAVDLGKGEGRIGVRQRPTVVDGKVYAAAIGGGVLALDLHTGQVLWKYVPAQGSNAKDNKKFSKKSMLASCWWPRCWGWSGGDRYPRWSSDRFGPERWY